MDSNYWSSRVTITPDAISLGNWPCMDCTPSNAISLGSWALAYSMYGLHSLQWHRLGELGTCLQYVWTALPPMASAWGAGHLPAVCVDCTPSNGISLGSWVLAYSMYGLHSLQWHWPGELGTCLQYVWTALPPMAPCVCG